MPISVTLDRIGFASVTATSRTEWTFAEIHDGEGVLGISEITFGDSTPKVASTLVELLQRLRSVEIDDESRVPAILGLGTTQLRADRALAAAVSAIRTAIAIIQSQRSDQSLTEALGGKPVDSVPLYANINRSLFATERTPKDFAYTAERAVRDGFEVIKCAPFDEVRPPSSVNEILEAARPGIERVTAVREAVGPDVEVLVDCHSRFEVHTAPLIAEELAKLDVGWFEEPVAPTRDVDGLVDIAGKVSIPLAGGESGYGEDFYTELIERGAVLTIMPDVKYCGGVGEAVASGKRAIAAGGRISLHSPSGPISQLAGAHVTAATPGAFNCEHAYSEADWRAQLVEPNERIEGGRFWLPRGVGLGATLNDEVVSRYGRRWNP